MTTWAKAKREWFKEQRRQCAANKAIAEQLAAPIFVSDETLAKLSERFDRAREAVIQAAHVEALELNEVKS